jgi:hypothetical protein
LGDLELRGLIQWRGCRFGFGFGRRRRLRFRWRGFFGGVRIAEFFDVVRIDISQLDRLIFEGSRFREFEPPTAIGAHPIDDKRQDQENYEWYSAVP